MDEGLLPVFIFEVWRGGEGGRSTFLYLRSLEASKGGMKVGRIKDPLYKDSYFGITPPTFIPPLEAPEELRCETKSRVGVGGCGT